jgi:hypothetical protein
MEYVELNLKVQVSGKVEDRAKLVERVGEAVAAAARSGKLLEGEKEDVAAVAYVVTDVETGYFKGKGI